MSHAHVSHRRSSLTRSWVLALVVSLISAGTAFAQSGPMVRVADEQIRITSSRHSRGWLLMTADPGTELVVIYTDGDRYRHLDSNWYWVQLPRDAWGTARMGWVSGRHVVPVPPRETPEPDVADVAPPQPAASAQDAASEADLMERARQALTEREAMAADPVAATDPPVIPEVVVNFEFDKSDLLENAKAKLIGVAEALKANAGDVSIALEGHADWTGPEVYNERLGLERAEAVKEYLAAEHGIAVDRISVVSYGENRPAASNDTREGRAQNRRVVLKVSSAPAP